MKARRLELEIDAVEQGVERHVHRAVDDHAQRALLRMLANEGQGAGKVRVDHGAVSYTHLTLPTSDLV